MNKLLFALKVEDDWPPVASEGVWCEVVNNNYMLKSVPFFINGLAFGDIFTAHLDVNSNHIFDFNVVEESGRSLLWILNNTNISFVEIKNHFLALECNVEEIEHFSMYAVDIPVNVNIEKLDKLIDFADELGFALAFPVWRH